MGYSGDIIESLGMIFLLLLAFVIIAPLCYLAYKAFGPKIKALLVKIKNTIFFNTILRSFLQTFLVFSLSAFMNVSNLRGNNLSDLLSSFLAIISTAICLSTPLVMLNFLKSKRELLKSENAKNTYGSLFIGLKI